MNPWGSKSAKKRGRLKIMAEILEIAEEKALKTQIMYRAGLSYTQVNNYLRSMLSTALLERFVQNGKRFYRATEKGLYFLRRYWEMTKLMQRENRNYRIDGKMLPDHPLRKVKSVVYMPKRY